MYLMNEDNDTLDRKIRNLLSLAQKGDKDAMAALYHIYSSRMQSAVKKRLGSKLRNRMESVDIVQSVWKDALPDMKEFEYRGPDSFFHWLLTRLTHKIQDKGRYFATEMRDAKKEERLVRDDTETPGVTSPPSQDPTPSEVAMADEDRSRFMKLLEHLPGPQRQALILRMREELTFEKIGAIMNRSADAVRKLYGRGMMRMGELILDAKAKSTEDD